jgi:hypothetical protein
MHGGDGILNQRYLVKPTSQHDDSDAPTYLLSVNPAQQIKKPASLPGETRGSPDENCENQYQTPGELQV